MELSTPRLRRYFALHYYLFRFLGVGWWHHPDEKDTRNFPGWYLYYSIITQIVFVVGFVGLESIDPFIGKKDTDRFMMSLAFVITHGLTFIKLFIFYFKNVQIQDIVRTLEVGLYEYYQNNKMNQATVRITKILTGSALFVGWIIIGNTNVYCIIQDFRWKAEVAKLNNSSLHPLRTLPLPIYIPWKYQTDISFTFTFVMETLGWLWTGHIALTIDTFIGSVILHMSTQFKILREAFITAYDRTMLKLYEDFSNSDYVEVTDTSFLIDTYINEDVIARYPSKVVGEALEDTLKKCFRQHQVLIGCAEKFAETYSYGFMIQLLSSTLAICVLMVQVSEDASTLKSMRLVTSLAFFAAMIIQLAVQCFTANELTLQASRISDAVMDSNWENMSPRLRRLLMITMMRAQRPLHLSAAGFAYLNNDCFVAIVKAAYSYYAVISQKQSA